MSNVQKNISILLERFPKWELSSYEHQTTLDRLRDRLSSTSDINEELRRLYEVEGFANFALSLMWIADKVEKDPTREETTLDEETLVFSLFRQAIGAAPPTEQIPAPSTPITESFPPSVSTPEPPATPKLEVDSIWNEATQQQGVQSSVGEGTSQIDQERSFASMLERFLESVQSGNDDRTTLMSDVINECNRILATSTIAEDYRQFCQFFVNFLQYISDNQYLDDVRVMNIVSNIQDPFTQWAKSEPSNRAGLLDQSIEILRDFKTMFE